MAKTKPVYTIRDIAKKAGVSLASVTQTYRNPQRVGEAVRQKVLKAAKELNFIPKFIVKRSAFGNVGVLIDKNRGPFGEFYSHIIMGILEKAAQLKWNISIELYDSDTKTKFPPMIKEKRVDGVILLSKHEDIYIETLKSRNIPYCVVDYISDKLKHNCVRPDWKQGARLATEYLVKNGHKLIAMVHSPLEKGRASLYRVEGYNEILDENNIHFQPGYVQDGKFSYDESYKVTKKILKCSPRPTAIFCATDVMALGAYKAIKEAKLKIPKDISVVGLDNIEMPYYVDPIDPSLTTVDGDKTGLGSAALELVQNIIMQKKRTPKEIILPMHLVKRASVKKI